MNIQLIFQHINAMQCTKEKKEKQEFSNGKIQVCAPVLGNNTTQHTATQHNLAIIIHVY